MYLKLSIEAYLLDLGKRFQIKKVLYDPYQMAGSATRLTKQGLPMEEFRRPSIASPPCHNNCTI